MHESFKTKKRSKKRPSRRKKANNKHFQAFFISLVVLILWSVRMVTLPMILFSEELLKLSNDVKEQTVLKLKKSKFFSLQLDELTDSLLFASHTSLHTFDFLATTILKNILFCQALSTTTTGEDIFNVVDKFFRENNIDWAKCLSVYTDGAPSMMGCRKKFVAHVKKVSVQAIHYMLLQENLTSRQLSATLHGVMKDVTKIANFLKARGLNSRLFQE